MRVRASHDVVEFKPQSGLDLESLREELDEYYKQMLQFRYDDPREILLKLSSFRARASQLRTFLLRNEERGPMQQFRTKELDPFREECEFQFKIWSRLISAAQIDWEMSRGQT